VALRSPGITSGITVEPSCGQGECREATRWIHGWPQLATSYQRPQQNYVALEWHLLKRFDWEEMEGQGQRYYEAVDRDLGRC
jgi:hypothetical protein